MRRLILMLMLVGFSGTAQELTNEVKNELNQIWLQRGPEYISCVVPLLRRTSTGSQFEIQIGYVVGANLVLTFWDSNWDKANPPLMNLKLLRDRKARLAQILKVDSGLGLLALQVNTEFCPVPISIATQPAKSFMFVTWAERSPGIPGLLVHGPMLMPRESEVLSEITVASDSPVGPGTAAFLDDASGLATLVVSSTFSDAGSGRVIEVVRQDALKAFVDSVR